MKRWMHRSGRPGALARVMNRISAIQFSAGLLSPNRAMTVEAVGRRAGRLISFPVVVTDCEGEGYLVSMLGNDVGDSSLLVNTQVRGTKPSACIRLAETH